MATLDCFELVSQKQMIVTNVTAAVFRTYHLALLLGLL